MQSPGWNDLALHVFPNWYASDVCAQSRVVKKVARWSNEENAFEEYTCDAATIVDFRIIPNVGYMVMSEGPGPAELIATGPVVPYFTELKEGNNLIGLLPLPSMPGKASEFCGPIRGTDLKVTWVNQFLNGTWSPHLCPPYPQFNNFALSLGKVYLLNVVQVDSQVKVTTPAIPALPL